MSPSTILLSATKPHRIFTLILPLDLANNRILLGLKRRGFGTGKLNGFGGKFEPALDSSIRSSAARELLEEACLSTTSFAHQPEGVLLLETLADEKQAVLEIWVFTVQQWEGQVGETEEMTPQWFTISSDGQGTGMPYDKMWEESCKWLPDVVHKYFCTNDGAEGRSQQQKRQNGKYFIHHVEFGGGLNKETGEVLDVWHGMGSNRVEWVDDLPLSTFQV